VSVHFELSVGRVVVHGEALHRAQAEQLHRLIEEELKASLLVGPLPEPEATDRVQVEAPAFGLAGPEGARRLAMDIAKATLRALRGERDG
jgi:hypothetical protein